MSVIVEIADAQSRLAELVAQAEAGETVVLARGNRPAARIAPLATESAGFEAADEILRLRESRRIEPVTIEETLAWRHEGHRY